MSHRIALGKLQESTRERYCQTATSFGEFLKSRALFDLPDVTRSVVEDFKAWRLTRVIAKKELARRARRYS
jgi:hypothetical protein